MPSRSFSSRTRSRATRSSVLLVLQPHQHPAVDVGKQLLHEPDVHDRGAMDAHEPARVEPGLELGERVVDDVLAAVDDGEGELVLRQKW